MNNKQVYKYLRFANFDDTANDIMNLAVKYAMDESCDYVGIVHILLALMEKSELGRNALNELGITFDMIYESYQMLASEGEYGVAENKVLYNPEYFSPEVFNIIGKLTMSRAIQGLEVTADSLFDEIIEFDSDELNRFLEYVGISIDELHSVRKMHFEIPDFIESFVEDLNSKESLHDELIVGVDDYIDEMIEVLNRKTKANPCLVGEAGVGKTTIVYGLVKRIIEQNVPNSMKETHVCYINGSMLTAGTRFRGDFEERMKFIMDWASNNNVILFLDEIHAFINAGGGSNSSETAGNMIKQSLSNGDIRIIGATTTSEYHEFIESDKAFVRRLQEIDVNEPSEDNAIKMICNSIKNYEDYHKVSVDKNIIELTVNLSNRYIKNMCLPDKAYTIIDQACTKVKLSHRKKVTENDILSVVSKISGIDITKIDKSEGKKLMSLEDTISKNVIGQKKAISIVSKAIRRSKAGVREENKPLASFLFVGPTGVGKTELCKVLSNELCLSKEAFIKIDMSEFSEKYSTSKIIGSAPGYVGYKEGGFLTEKVKHNPYSLVLFDEIEKANPEIFNLMLQLLDEGRLTDGEGTTVDFTNCIIVMTSNAGYGAEILGKGKLGFVHTTTNDKETEKIVMDSLKETFKPEFLNRIDNVVVFDKLSKDEINDITRLLLDKLTKRIDKNNNINIVFDTSIIEHIASKAYSEEYGARNVKREIQNTIEDILADKILTGELKKNHNYNAVFDEEIKINKKEQ